jgi:hypothetical protein
MAYYVAREGQVNYAIHEREASAYKEENPKRLPLDKQIRIDVDRHPTGDVRAVGICNVLKCDMSEYGRAIRFLEQLPVLIKIGPDVMTYCRRLRMRLKAIEDERIRGGGAPYDPANPM